MPKLSVIVPVYNVEKYLRQCIESVLKQDFDDFELILVNDGSTDASAEICDDYAIRDSRVKVVQQAHSGPSKARNLGLKMAQGDWISFVDADDIVDNDFFDDVSKLEIADIVYFGFKYVTDKYTQINKIEQEGKFIEEGIDDVYASLLKSKEAFFGYTVDKFLKKSIIKEHNICFPENIVHKEDEVFAFRYSHHVKKIFISDKAAYNYRIHNQSTTHSPNFKFQYWELSQLIEKEIKKSCHLALRNAFIGRNINYLIGALKENYGNDKFKYIYTHFKNFVKINKKNIYISGKWNLFIKFPYPIAIKLLRYYKLV